MGWRDAGRSLDDVGDWLPAALLILTDGAAEPTDPQDEIAAVRLARRLATGTISIVAGCAHPSADWRDAVRQAGADHAFLVSTDRGGHRGSPLEGAVEFGDDVCPALHVRRDSKTVLNVCGRHHDRMVLVRRHLDRWCLGRKTECPHWQGLPDE